MISDCYVGGRYPARVDDQQTAIEAGACHTIGRSQRCT